MYGMGGAPLTIDLATGEVRLKTHEATVKWAVKPGKLKPLKKLVHKAKQLAEERRAEAGNPRARPPITFTAQLAEDHITIIAERKRRKNGGDDNGILSVSIDLNSRYGAALLVLSFPTRGEPKMHELARVKPQSHSGRRLTAAKLQSLADDPRIPLQKRLFYAEEARRVRRREKTVNEAYVDEVVSKVRKWLEWAEEKGYSSVILVDVPDPESLRGTPLQGTVTRIRRKLRNLAEWYGARYVEFGNGGKGVSGRYCPLCGREMKLLYRGNGRRLYYCAECNITADRDFNTCWNAAIRYLKDKREAVKNLLRQLGPRALGSPPGWPPTT